LVRLGAACLLAMSCGAQAQIPTSSSDTSIRPARPRGDVNRAEPIFRRTVACIVERSPSRTRNLLDTTPGTQAEARIMSSFQSRLDWCFNAAEGGISFSWDVLRGGIAEIYYHQAFPSGLPRQPANADAALTAAWSQPRTVEGGQAQLEMLHAAARCTVLRRPGVVSDLLAADPLSPAELAAIRAIQGDFAACVAAGVTFTASRQSLRGLLVEAALHYGEANERGFRPAPTASASAE
jgi:hypothetical protein